MASAFSNLCRDLFGRSLFIKGKLVIDKGSNIYAHDIKSNSLSTITVYTDRLCERVLNRGITICGNIVGNNIVLVGDTTIDGNLTVNGILNLFDGIDMHCANIGNVMNLHVNKLVPKFNSIIWGDNDTQINTTPSPQNVNNIAIGNSAKSGFNGVAIGYGPYSYGNSVAIGSQTCMSTLTSSSVGKFNVGHHESVSIGYKNISWGNCVAIGTHAYSGTIFSNVYQSLTNNSIAIGSHVVADNTGIALGHYTQAYHGYGHISIGKETNAGVPYKNANFAIAIGGFASAEGNKDISIGYSAFSSVVYGNNTISIGNKTVCNGNGTVSMGLYATCNSSGSVAIGRKSYLGHNYSYGASNESVAIGASSYVYNCPKSISIGYGASCYAVASLFQENKGNSIAIGANAYSHALNSIAMGHFANSISDFSISIGDQSTTNALHSISIGNKATITQSSIVPINNSISIGHNSTVNCSESIAIGYNTECVASPTILNRSIAIGSNSQVLSLSSISIGNSAYTNDQNSISIGYGAKVYASNKPPPHGSIAIGTNCSVQPNCGPCLVMGYQSTVDDLSFSAITIGTGSVSGRRNLTPITIGYQARSYDYNVGSIAIGTNSYIGTNLANVFYGHSLALGTNTDIGIVNRSDIAIGHGTRVGNLDQYCTSVGAYSVIYGNVNSATAVGHLTIIGDGSSYSTSVGYSSRVLGNSKSCLAVGLATVYGNVRSTVAIGHYATSVANRSIALGYNVNANVDDGFFAHHRVTGPTIYNAHWIGDELVEVPIPSSRRFKENIIDLEDINDKFDQLRPVRYNLKEPLGTKDEIQIGLIAEEVNELFPEFVIYGPENRVDGLQFDRMVTLAIKEIQSLKNQISLLKDENRKIKLDFDRRLENIESRLN